MINETGWQWTAMELQQKIDKYPYCAIFKLMQYEQGNLRDKNQLSLQLPFREVLRPSSIKRIVQQQEKLQKNTTKTEKNTKKRTEVAKEKQELTAEDILQQRLQELQAKAVEPVVEEEEIEDVYSPTTASVEELIERFNKMPPRNLTPALEDEEELFYKDLAKSSLQEKTNIVSETLAKLYKEQGAYDKAIKIYEVLMTKYPEKSVTFASCIDEIKLKKEKDKIN
jgi:tetratricopeptide (TPR) repeat protein